ncbi:P-loop NTPase fold protein, partial [Lichenihabitans sp. Uapishka_5]|uniref:P-loop NTPase fold protein n=1 Tax=Lichenihabitans sp. Uapishka_5 TaxID=3037302 RepID=UPI0029E817FD
MSVTDQALQGVAERPVAAAPQPARLPPALFTADAADGVPSSAPLAAFLADLALHRAAATPLCVGLFGPPGSGKSSLLGATLDAVSALGDAAGAAGIATPFVAGAGTLLIRAEPGRDPYRSLLQQAHDGLVEAYPAVAAEATHGLGDPQATAREADERLGTARQRLDEERRRLDESTARQARIVETVLFDESGSRVDAYARANRGRIDRAMRRFGFAGDPLLAFKEAVRDAAEPGLGRGLGFASAFWAYRGQLRLLAVGIGFFVATGLLGSLMEHGDGLLEALRSSNDKMGPTVDWLGAHRGWLAPLHQLLQLAGVVALAINVVRALRFVQPIARGVTLLQGDLDARRHDLDGLVAHQARRVEALSRDLEQASSRAAEAERRLAGAAGPTSGRALAGLGDASPAGAARSFFASLSSAILAAPQGGAPARLIVALDGFERLSPKEAAAYLEAAHLCFDRPGFVILLAAERDHLAAGLAEADPALARATLHRIVQVPVAVLVQGGDAWPEGRRMAEALLRPVPAAAAVTLAPEAGRSAFDKPWIAKEAAVVEA